MTKKDLSKKIISQIKKKNIRIKPKFYFIIGSLFFSFGISAFFLLSVLFINIAFFRLQFISFLLPLYPSPFQIRFLLTQLPFFHLFLSLFLFILGLIFLKKSGLAYRFNPVLVFFTTFLLVIILGLLLNHLGINRLGPRLAPPLYQHQPFRQTPPRFNR